MKQFIKSIIIPFAVILFISGCGGSDSDTNVNNQDTVRVGAILPLTGDLAFLGEPGKNALEIAEENINSNGGINGKNIEILFYDSKGDPKTGVTEFQRAINLDNLNYVITTLTGVSLAIKPIANENNVLQLIIAIYPEMVTMEDNALRICYNAEQEANKIIQYITENNIDQIGILQSKDAASEKEVNDFILPALSEENIEYRIETFDVSQREFSTLALKVSDWDTEDLLILGYGSDIANILRELNNQNILNNTEIIGGIGFVELPESLPQELKTNIKFASPLISVDETINEISAEFISQYKQRHPGETVTYDAAFTYDTISILSEIMNETENEDPLLIKEAIKEKGVFRGVTGEIEILPSGDSNTEIIMAEFDNGKMKSVE